MGSRRSAERAVATARVELAVFVGSFGWGWVSGDGAQEPIGCRDCEMISI